MADPREAVIFRTEADMQRSASGPGDERGRKIADAGFNREARVDQRFRQPVDRLLFFKSNLGVGVNSVTQGNEIVSRLVKSLQASRFPT